MSNQSYKDSWKRNYSTAPLQLKKMSRIKGLISAFNANIDAVIKISGKRIGEIISSESMDPETLLNSGATSINSKEDSIRGIVKCFSGGIAEEWLIEDEEVYRWLNETLGYDQLQMGGQGGIVANAMAVCGVNPVYVHCASLPEKQGKLFLDLPNLVSVDSRGEVKKANGIAREDLPLIHWIIEFDKGDVLQINGKTITCPKSNRFIATYDPLNFRLAIDKPFAELFDRGNDPFEYIILSGYQMLKEDLEDGEKGIDRIDKSMAIVKKWRENAVMNHILHFEIASTQDKVIRKYLLDKLAVRSDSLGFNERELIDMLEVIGEEELANLCHKETNSANLFKGMLKIYDYTKCPRLQLHMFGLYVTLQRKGFSVTPEQNRNGMQLAAVIAAAKAGTGDIHNKDVLLWAADKEVSETGLKELESLSEEVKNRFGANDMLNSGIFENKEFEVIAVPTILIENPVTLVGMGDTISSISLVAAR